jgi:hypothetical protein
MLSKKKKRRRGRKRRKEEREGGRKKGRKLLFDYKQLVQTKYIQAKVNFLLCPCCWLEEVGFHFSLFFHTY